MKPARFTLLLVALSSPLFARPYAARTLETAPPAVKAYCFGVSCPCSNDQPQAGCANSSGRGVRLSGYGSTSVWADDLTLSAFPAPNGPKLLYMGGAPASVPFGDGLRCVGPGASGLVRDPYTSISSASQPGGSILFQWHGIVAGSGGAIQPGATWYFQVGYRDLPGPCGAGFNFTNGVEATFAP